MTAKRTGGITRREAARPAGVSSRTVSYVVNDLGYVSTETRARMQKVLAKSGCRPDLAARNLRQGRTGTIALILPLSAPHFAELTEFIVDAARSPLALGAMRTVLRRGLRVPEDVAVAGSAVDLLVDRMNGETCAPITRNACAELVTRECTTGRADQP